MSKNKYSDELRNEVLKEYDNEVEVPVLSKKYNIPKPTIYSWIRNRKDIPERENNLENSINIKEVLLENRRLKEELNHIKYNLDLISRNVKTKF